MTGLEFEGFQDQPEAEGKLSAPDPSLYVDYSSRLVDLLSIKAEAYNGAHDSSEVTLTELKSVYREAGLNLGKSKDCGEWCLARVNMFLRMKAGENVYNNKPEQEKKELTSLEFEVNQASQREAFNITEGWTPSEKDLELARIEMKEKNLDLDFEHVDNLYLEEYERIEIEW